ncbi:phosphotransferase, partial [Brachyspira sp.]|uniref:phosphotransferase n=1 Tax=Brachyspira sp. TaxID=1977261 RepID=UPI00262ADAFB
MDKSDKKNRMLELLKNNNLNYKDLILYLIKETKGNKSDYDTIKTNFSKMVSGERNFKYEYIPLIERKLKTTLDYIINGYSEELNGFIPRGLRYTAFTDDYQKYQGLLDELKLKDNILSVYDEYEKNIADYIIEQKSLNGIKYLIDNNLINNLSAKNIFSIIDIIIEKEPKYLTNILNFHLYSEKVFDNVLKKDDITITINGAFNFVNVFKDDISKYENLILEIFKNDNLFNLFFLEEGSLSINKFLYEDNNYKIYSFNIMILLFIDRIINSNSIYKIYKGEEKLNKIISFINKYNDFLYKELYEEEINTADVSIEYLKLDNIDKEIYSENLYFFLCKQNNKAGLIFRNDKYKKSVIKDTLKEEFSRLEEKFVKSKSIKNNKIIFKGNKIYKIRSKNEKEYEFLKLMQNNNYNKVPRYYGYEDGYDIYEYIEGTTEQYIYMMPLEKIYQVLDALKEINEISKKHLNGKVYVHNDLSSPNVVFDNKGKLKAIIDWEHCKIGEEHEDLIYIIWTWANIGAL